MKLVPVTVGVAIVLAVLFTGVGIVAAHSQTPHQYGGGYLAGTVYGYTYYGELTTLDWVPITASNGQGKFTTWSAGGGQYGMYVPSGTYNVTVDAQGFQSQSSSVAVSTGAELSINFFLERSNVPIPEFPAQAFALLMIIAVAGSLFARRATKPKYYSKRR
jgi:hypothetical protein